VVGTHREPRALQIVAEVEHGPDEGQALLLGGRIFLFLGLQGAAVASHEFRMAVRLLFEQSALQLSVGRIDVAGEGRAAAGERQDSRMKKNVA